MENLKTLVSPGPTKIEPETSFLSKLHLSILNHYFLHIGHDGRILWPDPFDKNKKKSTKQVCKCAFQNHLRYDALAIVRQRVSKFGHGFVAVWLPFLYFFRIWVLEFPWGRPGVANDSQNSSFEMAGCPKWFLNETAGLSWALSPCVLTTIRIGGTGRKASTISEVPRDAEITGEPVFIGRRHPVFKKLCKNPLVNPVGYLVRELMGSGASNRATAVTGKRFYRAPVLNQSASQLDFKPILPAKNLVWIGLDKWRYVILLGEAWTSISHEKLSNRLVWG